MDATFDFHPKKGKAQRVVAFGITDQEAAQIRSAIANEPGAVIRVSCTVTPGAESVGVRIFEAGRIRNFQPRR